VIDVLARGDFTIAVARGALSGEEAVRWLTADYAVVCEDAVIILDTAKAWGAAIWRIGADAFRRHLAGMEQFTAGEAVETGLADRLVPRDFDAAQWLRGRSELALASAAALIRARGGDALERAEFARLFAAGEPQIGLNAFLEKRRPEW
jgi:enoyl-CoA hydratase/carnithine racemase